MLLIGVLFVLERVRDSSCNTETDEASDKQTRRDEDQLVSLEAAHNHGPSARSARCPSERAFHHAASWQQDKAPFSLGQFDDFQLYPMLVGCLGRCVTPIGLINESQFDRLSCRFLHCLSQLAHLGAVLLIGWGDQQCQQIAQRIDSGMDFAAFASLGSIIARAAATDLSSEASSDYRR